MSFEILPNYLLLEMLAGIAALLAAFLILGKLGEADGREKPLGKRLEFFDFAKGAAMLGVICIHAGTLAQWGNPGREIFGFAIPAFIICSGYLLARRYAVELELGKYFRSLLFRIVLVYAMFTVALHFLHNGFTLDPAGLALDLLLGRADNGSFYFIPLMIQLYLIFPLLRNNRAVLSRAGLTAAWCFSLYFSYLTWTWSAPEWNSNQLAIAFFGRCAFFFVFGMWLARFDFEALGARASAALAGVFFAASALLSALNGQAYLGYLFCIGVFFLLHAAFYAWKKALGKTIAASALAEIGKHSLAIYMVHASVIFGLLSRLPFEWSGPLGYLALVATAVPLSYAAARVFIGAYNRAVQGIRA